MQKINMKYKLLLPCLCALAFGVFVVGFPRVVSGAVGGAIACCLEVVVPSLFAFTALAVYLTQSGLHRTVLKPAAFLLSKLLRIDEELCGVLLLSNIGGYPVGARLLRSFVESGRMSREDAGRMLCCCYGSGPSFVIGIAGVGVFGSAAAGAALFAACFLGSMACAAVMRTRGKILLQKSEQQLDLSAECFVGSVMAAAEVMFTVCVMVVLFAVVSAAADAAGIGALFGGAAEALGAKENAGNILPALLEVSRVKALLPTGAAFPLCAALLSFGGVCVLLQVRAVAKGIPMGAFLLSRLLAAAVSAGAAALLSPLIPQPDIAVIAAGAGSAELFSVNAGLSLCVLGMSATLLLSSVRGKKQR